MKKAVIVIVLVFAVIVTATVLFFVTFNADHYRPTIIQMIEKSTGKKASLDKIYLGFKNGITLNLNGISLSDENSNPGIRVERVMANVRLMPLLKKEIQITQISIKSPSIEILKSSEGRISVAGFSQDSSKTQPSGKQGSASSQEKSSVVTDLSIENIQIRDGQIHYIDNSAKPSTSINVEKLDVDVKNFSLTKPFEIVSKASLYSKEQNIYANVLVTLPAASSAGYAQNVVLQTDLSKLSYPVAGLKKLNGVLQLTSEKIVFGEMNSRIDVLLKDGLVSMEGLPSDVTNINVQAHYQNDNATISSLSAIFAEAPIRINGNIEQISSKQNLNFQASLRDLSIDRIAKIANPKAPRLDGKLSVDVEGVGQGLTWPSISRTLNARGQLGLKEGVVLNYNVLREVVQKLGAIPGVQEALSANFPQSYQAAINENSTLLKPVLLPFTVKDGVVGINPVSIDSDFVSIFGALSYRLDNFVSLDALLRLNAEISSVLARTAPMIGPILNQEGLLEVPFTAQGTPPQVKVQADVKGVTSKIISAKAGEVVSEILKDPSGAKKNIKGILQRVAGGGESVTTAAGDAAAPEAEATSKTGNSFDSILGQLTS